MNYSINVPKEVLLIFFEKLNTVCFYITQYVTKQVVFPMKYPIGNQKQPIFTSYLAIFYLLQENYMAFS